MASKVINIYSKFFRARQKKNVSKNLSSARVTEERVFGILQVRLRCSYSMFDCNKRYVRNAIVTYFVCVCLCVCACVYILSLQGLFPSATMSGTYLRGTDQRSCVVSMILGTSAKFFHLCF